jgi:hypothetical protein
MVKHLHKDFLSNREQYVAAANYWRMFCERLLDRNGQLGSWQPWFGIHQKGELAPIEEGAIYSLYSQEQKKAINIEQYMPKTEDIDISAMVDTFGEGTLESPIEYLTICCALSDESAEVARQLIEVWVRRETTVSDIQNIINRLIPN